MLGDAPFLPLALQSCLLPTPLGEVHLVDSDPDQACDDVLLFLHGYPDSHEVWALQMERLATRYRVAAFDWPGIGQSPKPRVAHAYRLDQLVKALGAVVAHLGETAKRIHVIAHDWGSVAAWKAVEDPAFAKQIASYSSMSGPHWGVTLKHTPMQLLSANGAARGAALRQISRSWYIYAFGLPWLPELAMAADPLRFARTTAKLGGVPPADGRHIPSAAQAKKNQIAGLGFYRDNLFHGGRVPPAGSIKLPIQLIVPTQDRFLEPATFELLHLIAADMTVAEIAANHWAMRSHPDEVTALIEAFVRQHSVAGTPSATRKTKKGKIA